MRLVRWLLGRILTTLDWLTRPALPQRPAAEQARLDRATAGLALYQFQACPFCIKVRRAMRRLGLNIELRDARNDPGHKQTLIAEGGRYQVPCLRIPEADGSVRWLYESDEIISYLRARYVPGDLTQSVS